MGCCHSTPAADEAQPRPAAPAPTPSPVPAPIPEPVVSAEPATSTIPAEHSSSTGDPGSSSGNEAAPPAPIVGLAPALPIYTAAEIAEQQAAVAAESRPLQTAPQPQSRFSSDTSSKDTSSNDASKASSSSGAK
ncbi:hypothetical protein S40293_10390 [Stachybotrys chartarum IBT 40293]|nr:hypothetical protein S40293_10390 [Stachybotrys chartarum IBT 40293]KFA72982.1 hypothetical protein S40288_10989 [Stachybotrys chartarum IBT 40288]